MVDWEAIKNLKNIWFVHVLLFYGIISNTIDGRNIRETWKLT